MAGMPDQGGLCGIETLLAAQSRLPVLSVAEQEFGNADLKIVLGVSGACSGR